MNLTIPCSTSQAVLNFDIKVQFMKLKSSYSTSQAVLNVYPLKVFNGIFKCTESRISIFQWTVLGMKILNHHTQKKNTQPLSFVWTYLYGFHIMWGTKIAQIES